MKKFSSFLVILLLMLASFTAGMEYPRGDVNYDGQVSIKDVTCLIDYLLNGTWEDEPVNPDEPQTETFTVNGVSFTMVAVEGGTFTMGATAEQGNSAQDNEKPAHEVIISSFCIGETEVTQELWQAVMGNNPSSFTGDPQRPVEMVSWINCKTFINRLNQLTGKTFRLPTEAEWEFAARGGNQSQGYIYSGSNTIGDVAWYYQNSSYTTHPVATKAPNELGLYDMSGNVTEWCQDWYGSYSSDAQTNPVGPSTGYSRVHRGGIYASACRVSYRSYFSPTNTSDFCGLRLAFDPDNGSTPEEHEYVDLGLPSGTLWATCNVGANTPEDYGDYFAWGETEPKNYYDNWPTYKWCNGSYNTMTKYCIQTDYGNNGFTDGKTVLDPEDDAAFVNWGPMWRMPTKDQQQELVDNCTWTWTTQKGVNGCLVVGPNGNSLFLPAASCYVGNRLWNNGKAGDYWSRSLTSDYSCSAHELVVYPSDAFGIIFHTQMLNRDYGLTVRAVRVQQD